MKTIKLKLVFFSILVFGFFSNSKAQQMVTLKEAIDYALQNKAAAIQAKLKVKNGDYQIQEAKAGIYPSVNINGGVNYNPLLQESILPGELIGQPGTTVSVAFGQKWNSSIGVGLTQKLFDQQVFIGLKAAKSTKEFYQINSQLTDEQVIENVATAYYQVFVQKQKKETLDSSYNSTNKIKNIIKSLYDNGLAKKIDLDRTTVNLTNISTSRQQLINGITQAENALKFYMGMPIETPIQLASEDFKPDDILLEETIDVNNLTQVKSLNKQKELLGFQKKSVESGYYPTLSLNGNYTWQGFSDVFPIGTSKSDGTTWSDYATIGLSLKIPVFQGFATKAKVSQADIDIQSLEQDINETKLSLSLAYENAKSQIENSEIAIKNQEANVELAQSVVDNSRSNYQNGLATLTDLLDSENALVEAKNNYSSAILDLKLAEVQLYKSKGELQKFAH